MKEVSIVEFFSFQPSFAILAKFRCEIFLLSSFDFLTNFLSKFSFSKITYKGLGFQSQPDLVFFSISEINFFPVKIELPSFC